MSKVDRIIKILSKHFPDKKVKEINSIALEICEEDNLEWYDKYRKVLDDWPRIPSIDRPIFPNLPIITCSQCGLRCDGPMRYVCQSINCPLGMGGGIQC